MWANNESFSPSSNSACTTSFLNPISTTFLIPSTRRTVFSYVYSSKYRSRKGKQESKCFLPLKACSLVPESSSGSVFYPVWHQEFQHPSRGNWMWTSLVGQRLRLCIPSARGLASIPGLENRSNMLQLRVCNYHYHPDPAGYLPTDPHIFLPQDFLHIGSFIHNCHYSQVPGHHYYGR